MVNNRTSPFVKPIWICEVRTIKIVHRIEESSNFTPFSSISEGWQPPPGWTTLSKGDKVISSSNSNTPTVGFINSPTGKAHLSRQRESLSGCFDGMPLSYYFFAMILRWSLMYAFVTGWQSFIDIWWMDSRNCFRKDFGRFWICNFKFKL